MVDWNDKNDMEDMEHEGEDENHVLTTMENNPNKEEKINSMLIEAMATHEALTKTFLNSIWKNAFLDTSNLGLECNKWFIIGSHCM